MLSDIDVLLLDIEGTITDIAFVQTVLFPYVRQNLRSYLERRWNEKEVQDDIMELMKLSKSEIDNGDHGLAPLDIPSDQAYLDNKDALLNAIVANVNHWMDADKKLGPLKQLQGHMWRDAYQSGEIKGHLYPDVIPAIKRILNETPVKICIYSSGSVLAQKLLFAYSCEGNVTNLLSNYFDTSIGPKTEAESYSRIAESLGVKPEGILFLTDVEREAYPAKQAGYKVGIVIRHGNALLTEEAKTHFPVLYSLDDLFFVVCDD